ncbi:MAG: cadherin-like beta sandwich domain-containing protein [Actinomycetes bacterium]|jgi:hypothetical protein|nr:cadherin-like beta sandwich domain-containing protein [Actinomycetes bacterium]
MNLRRARNVVVVMCVLACVVAPQAAFAKKKSKNAYAKSIKVSTGSLNKSFTKKRDSYALTIPYSQNSVKVTLTAADKRAKISSKVIVLEGDERDGKSLAKPKKGKLAVTIKFNIWCQKFRICFYVTAENGKTERWYFVDVQKNQSFPARTGRGKPTHTITLDWGGLKPASKNITFQVADGQTLGEGYQTIHPANQSLPRQERYGYDEMRWVDSSGDYFYNSSVPDTDVTFRPEYVSDWYYTLLFDANNKKLKSGRDLFSSYPIEYEKIVTAHHDLRYENNLAVPGFIFQGWYTQKKGGKKVDIFNLFEQTRGKYGAAREIKVYGHWKKAGTKAIIKHIAKTAKKEKGDLARLERAAAMVAAYAAKGDYTSSKKGYNQAYGVFRKGVFTCAGATRALGAVLKKMGYKWKHMNPNKWNHQWCVVSTKSGVMYADAAFLPTGDVGWGKYSFIASQE